MKLKDFIKELEKFLKISENPENIDVRMADDISVVKPFFKDGTVYITDIDNKNLEN